MFQRISRILDKAGHSQYLHVQILALSACGVLAIGMIVIGQQFHHSTYRERASYAESLTKVARSLDQSLIRQRLAEVGHRGAGQDELLQRREALGIEAQNSISSLRAVLTAHETNLRDTSLRDLIERVEDLLHGRNEVFQGLVQIERTIGRGIETGLKAQVAAAAADFEGRFSGDAVARHLLDGAHKLHEAASDRLAENRHIHDFRFSQLSDKLERDVEALPVDNPQRSLMANSLRRYVAVFRSLTHLENLAQAQSDLLARGYADQDQAVRQLINVLEDIKTEADASAEDLSHSAATLVLAITFVSLILAFLVSKRVKSQVSEPLQDMAHGFERLARGELEATVAHVRRRDEIGKLSRSFYLFQRKMREAVSLADDLTIQREQLLKREMVLELILSASPVGIAVVNTDDVIVSCNSRYSFAISGNPDEVVVGQNLMAMWQRLADNSLVDGIGGPRDENGELVRMSLCKFKDGRSCRVLRQPAPNGWWVAIVEDVTDRVRMDEHIAHLALHDSLTDLPNRAHFTSRLERALEAQGAGAIYVYYLDLDRFKEVNDSFGHAAGDALLRMVAQRLRNVLDGEEFVARLGGDEFAVFHRRPRNDEDASLLAKRIIDVVSAPYAINGRTHVIGCSIGISVSPNDATGASDLLVKADLALYRSKQQGRGIYHFFALDMAKQQEAALMQERDLRDALVHGQFEIWYQPIYSLDRLNMVACEALLRWRHPTRGLVGPADFIPIVERSGLISPIGGWVLRKACADAATWPTDIKVCVNVSVVQLRSAHLKSVIKAALDASGLPPSRLEIEITESLMLAEDKVLIQRLEDIRTLGISLAMDDFGSGHSVLSSLGSFPFDKIKLDKYYVQGLSTGRNISTAIVRAVAAMTQDLDVDSVGEGVETPEQLALIRSMGVTHAQGYLLARPMPQAQLIASYGDLMVRTIEGLETTAFQGALLEPAAA